MIPEEAKRNKLFDQANEDRKWCWGCGQSKYLSRAHIIRISAREDLKYDISNMSYLCLSIDKKGCHDIWDENSWTILEEFEEIWNLKCFTEFMNIIKVKDSKLYREKIRIMHNWLDYYRTNELPFGYKLK